MKLLFTAILLTLSINSFSQEMRSPKFTCTENDSGAEYFVLVGNQFPQIPNLDYSSELQLVESKYYYDGTASMDDIFTIKNITDTSFETEILDLETEGIDLGKISLKMTSDGKLTQTFVMPKEHAQFLGISDPNMKVEFTCGKF